MDSLTPILKKDWKKYTVKIKKKITFDNRIKEIRRKLGNGIALTESEKGFLKRQRQYYGKNTILKEREEKLDTLVPLLEYDWIKKLRIFEVKTFGENFNIQELVDEITQPNAVCVIDNEVPENPEERYLNILYSLIIYCKELYPEKNVPSVYPH